MNTARREPTPWAHFIRRLFPAYVIFHLCGTHFPKPVVPRGTNPYYLHFLIYMILTAVLWEFVRTFTPRIDRWLAVKIAVMLLAFAAFDEITQPILGRTADIVDWLYDLAAITLALTLLFRLRNRSSASAAASTNVSSAS